MSVDQNMAKIRAVLTVVPEIRLFGHKAGMVYIMQQASLEYIWNAITNVNVYLMQVMHRLYVAAFESMS